MNNNDETMEPTDDQLAQLPAEKLAQMLREKRRSEGNYRTQLREVEADRDRLAEAVQGYQRASFDEFARGRKVLDSAVDDVAEKVNVAELLGDDGQLDEERAAEALEALRSTKPHFFEAAPSKSSADFTGFTADAGEKSASWGDILNA
ncbi:hypothetical protein ACTXKN_04390 [Brachybacterium alimentarium]|uniref:hypothetical protein n=1 Tax=Brachybacterium alimentarium TaxID=47845 RepID=UPI003FD676E2